MYNIYEVKTGIKYNEILNFNSKRKAKNYLRMKRLSKNKYEVLWK